MTFEMIEDFFIVAMAALGAVSLVLGLWKAIKELRKPAEQRRDMLSEHDRKLLNDFDELNRHEERLSNLEQDVKEIEAQNRILISGMKTLMMHEIDGVNHIHELEVEYGILDRYLSGGLDNIA